MQNCLLTALQTSSKFSQVQRDIGLHLGDIQMIYSDL